MDTIWESTLDGIYRCSVTRIDESHGQLKVVNTTNETILLDKTVGLSYGAVFGPDVDDVADWQDECVDVVDNLPKEE